MVFMIPKARGGTRSPGSSGGAAIHVTLAPPLSGLNAALGALGSEPAASARLGLADFSVPLGAEVAPAECTRL